MNIIMYICNRKRILKTCDPTTLANRKIVCQIITTCLVLATRDRTWSDCKGVASAKFRHQTLGKLTSNHCSQY